MEPTETRGETLDRQAVEPAANDSPGSQAAEPIDLARVGLPVSYTHLTLPTTPYV